jgi:uncharacterized protein YgbK (DUF1537 family)
VLDDDPTGSQAASDVEVILGWDANSFRHWLRGGERGVYVVTNTRALHAPAAVELVSQLRSEVEDLARHAGEEVAFVLRGDSTLRGHVFDEIAAFETPGSTVLFVPAFPAAGRITLGGVHYLRRGAELVPVSKTEFAADPLFSYRAASLAGFVSERGESRQVDVVRFGLSGRQSAQAVSNALLCASEGAVVVPDVETDGDIDEIAAALLAAERDGRKVVVRSAAALAAARIGSRSARIQSVAAGGPCILVVCGSHTELSTAQLDALGGPVVTLDMDAVWPTLDGRKLDEVVGAVRAGLAKGAMVVLATQRARQREHDTVEHGAAMMHGLTSVVRRVRATIDACIVKGGITSAEVASIGLGSRHARVLGQLEPGISVWSLYRGERPPLPYVVVPGNIGTPDSLRRCVEAFVAGAS